MSTEPTSDVSLVIETLGGACPVQGFGTIDGERFYFRFRMDCAQLYVGPPEEGPPEGVDDWDRAYMPADPPQLYAELNDIYNDRYLGWLDDAEAHALLHRLIGMLKPPSEWQGGTWHDQKTALLDALHADHEGQQ